MMGLVAVLLSGLALVGFAVPACSFTAENQQSTGGDAMLLFDAPPDAFIPDAAPCSSLIKTCVAGTVLRACQQVGMLPTETFCPWDCAESPEPHCRVLVPSGGAVMSTDLDATGIDGKTFTGVTADTTFNTDNGSISANGLQQRASGTGIKNGIDFQIRNGVGIFRFKQLELNGGRAVRVTGANALAIVGVDKISITGNAVVDMRGTCSGRTSGPGGKQGGGNSAAGSGTGAGGAGATNGGACSGGGGAGNSSAGGPGGSANNNAGTTTGTSLITALVGGAGGGGGGGGGDGGGGGGAIQLVSNGPITFSGGVLQTVGLNAGGCGGKTGACGGGGGAGGAILIEGKTVDLGNGYFVVNGGGGAGAANGTSGELAQTTQRANGGNGGMAIGPNNDGGDGGDGADDASNAGPGSSRDNHGGGGGGGVGWIRINTKSGSMGQGNGAFVSPTLGSTSATTGTVNVN